MAAGIAALFAAQMEAQSSPMPPYTPTRQVAGVIHTWGSPQISDLLRRYEDGFRKFQPFVHFEDDLKSTVSGVAGVYTGRADIALMGREIWPSEVQAFESVTGHSPIAIEVATGAYDVPKATYALMIFVHGSNPITSLSTVQLDHIFGDAQQKPVRTWGELGLKGTWAKRSIHLYGFSMDNDKALIFSRIIFKQSARWNCNLHEYSNSSGVIAADAGDLILRAVAKDPAGIGISNIHYATQSVKVLPLSMQDKEPPVAPTRKNVASRRYPLSRAVYMVINRSAENPAVLEFLHYVLSRQGQEDVRNDGMYLPLTPNIVEEQRRLLESR
ncbi:PstS family phosphate ABC transporter substrate-binding protein [Edaphobacter bradus]|uniref:PstS family phosphate ABC transporter substrate-binding protein n=1 Tax=Edaphobacter bradus TaxID=2259016 RepID=UPI0021DF5FE5|nr:substrate-binding domain-containing protein [Edaphobacter bradus]